VRTWREGDRCDLGALQCDKVTTYERDKWDREGQETVYRYSLVSPTGDKFVYSGKCLGIKVGEYVDLRATIKRCEYRYNSVRLARPVITHRGLQNNFLNMQNNC
jgi:hypothetical protein